jgi:23S rRNA (adenine2030-N6)-methyltransferase
MLSYQHMYHAGSTVDVHKHNILVHLIKKLIQKDRPISYIETHSGRGIYDLSSAESLKTGEAKMGIEQIIIQEQPPYFNDYISLIKKLRQDFNNNNIYPGSPLIAQKILRPCDDIYLMELHPVEVRYLHGLTKLEGVKPQIHHRDGYEGVLAISPTKNRRGLVFIDPSFEVKSEYQTVVNFTHKLTKKWPQAVIMIWYPILPQNYHINLKNQLNNNNEVFYDEIMFKNNPDFGIQGSGVAIINKPWRLFD